MTEEHAAPALTEEQIDRLLHQMADSFAQQLRAPILHWPDEHGLDYEDVTFPALDGVPLEGWFIPCRWYGNTTSHRCARKRMCHPGGGTGEREMNSAARDCRHALR
jgi:hypothetical protein